MRSVYIASAIESRERAQSLAQQLRAVGARVVSTWHDKAITRAGDACMTRHERIAAREQCIREINGSTVFVLLYSDQCRSSLCEAEHAWMNGASCWLVRCDESDVPLMLSMFVTGTESELLSVAGRW